jgi:PadR family transcriptional regulator, regulatory protein PadR
MVDVAFVVRAFRVTDLRNAGVYTILVWATHMASKTGRRLPLDVWANIGGTLEKLDVQPGTLALMVLKTLDVMGPLHGYGVARRIEETSGNRLKLNYGTLYPALLKLEQEGFVTTDWGRSDNNRRAKFYSLTPAGRKQLAREAREWQQTADLIASFFAVKQTST